MNLKECFAEIRPTISVKGFVDHVGPTLSEILAYYFYTEGAITREEATRFAEAYIKAWVESAKVAMFDNMVVERVN